MSNELELDDVMKKMMIDKMRRYISGKLNSEILKAHAGIKNKKIKEDVCGEPPTNAMGSSNSSSVGNSGGPIDTYDPILGQKKKPIRRKPFDVRKKEPFDQKVED